MSNQSQNIVEFTLIYNQYKTKLYNYTTKMVSDRMVCEDIIQNTFIKLFEHMESIRSRDSIQYWLFTTVRNNVFSFYRSKKIRVDQFNVGDSDEVDVLSDDQLDYEYEQKELREIILKELDKMPIEQRDVFLLKEYSGMSYKEIAAVVNIDEELVKSRLHKIRQKLVKRLSKVLMSS